MAESIARIYHRTANPQGCLDSDGTRHWAYGVKLTGVPYDRAELMDRPRHMGDVDWIRFELATRISPGGNIIHAYQEEPNGIQG
ncbi:hypothetical protein [Arthrobacter sp. VKM Ac-2550]|uniref:hypothetical protein n=1 Tax=Crystallibacter permensis TaxID=1938888 RepID=UPI002226D523|nr:hypothetical protein [Arthrobacter sp. VKM Ac-2550]MCW2132906.1 hypothetical protein [Arthrobacter sp. VKM Ac-2550]